MGSSSNKSTVSNTVYGNTTTSNPYAYSKTDNKGTIAGFQDGTALNSVYNFLNKNIDSLLNEYLQPNLNSVQNKAKLQAFADTLAGQTKKNFENNIINNLSNRNMLRSSQANDLYKNLINQNVASVSNFANELLANSQSETSKTLSNLLNYYMLGANYLMNMQNHSLKASSGNATKTSSTTTGGDSAQQMINDILPIIILAITTSV